MGLATKIVAAASVAMAVGICAAIYVEAQPPTVTASPEMFSVHSGLYGEDISMRDVASISLEPSLPRVLVRTNGFAMGSHLRGHFRVERMGAGQLYVERNTPPFIVVRARRDFVIVNFEEPRTHAQLYELLARYHQRKSCESLNERALCPFVLCPVLQYPHHGSSPLRRHLDRHCRARRRRVRRHRAVRGETISAAWLLVAGVCTYASAYRFYARFIADRGARLDARRATPAERLNNGRDFVPTNRWVAVRPSLRGDRGRRARWSARCWPRSSATCPARSGDRRASCSAARCRTS